MKIHFRHGLFRMMAWIRNLNTDHIIRKFQICPWNKGPGRLRRGTLGTVLKKTRDYRRRGQLPAENSS
jgi:hypothetical protein